MNFTDSGYIKGCADEIVVGETYYFGQLWDGSSDGEELLESGSISPDGENVVDFDIVEASSDIMDTLVRVTGIY